MSSISSPHHMSAASAIHFRDPFVSKDSYHNSSTASWASWPRYQDLSRALTPPPDMNSVSQTTKPGYYQQEHVHHYGDYLPEQSAYRAPVAPYLPQEVSNTDFGRHDDRITQPSSRTISPIKGSRPAAVEEAQTRSQQRRGSHANAIAHSFQIPKSVNDSGGSLSELAAQITCLFWFESSELLQTVEDSSIPIPPGRALVSDAKPTIGFRKWVTTILSTTLVAQNVVLLALLFIYRLKKINPSVKGKPGSEYRLLTVALMLGNKFLDDNTYTNKTWAEVSGINVAEVHIMEVEFLSNMRYMLFTSAEDWTKWQNLLGKFAAFLERASRPYPSHPLAPILPPASSLHLPLALPSPPASNQASPPYAADLAQNGPVYSAGGSIASTPAPSPLRVWPEQSVSQQSSRKRNAEGYLIEPTSKRFASGAHVYASPRTYANPLARESQSVQGPRLTLPSLAIPTSSTASASYSQPSSQAQQLPPLSVPARAMAIVYPNASTPASMPQMLGSAAPAPPPPLQVHSQHQSRHQSPYPGSAAGSPISVLPHSTSSLHPPAQISPTYYLQQRDSPYRPVHNVSTLLYPPPRSALQQRPPNTEYTQMHYQPLGKPIQQRQAGRLPYVSQNVWLDGNHQPSTTPVSRWSTFTHPLPRNQ